MTNSVMKIHAQLKLVILDIPWCALRFMEEDNGEKALRMLKNIALKLENKVEKLEFGKKNSHLHIMIETKFLNKLKGKIQDLNISLTEHCRRKLMGDCQLDRIEKKINELKF